MRLYEDFTVGDVHRSAVGRTVTETDNLLFTMLSLNTNELHFNEEAAKETEWGRILVNSTFTLSLVLGLSLADTSQAGAVNLGWSRRTASSACARAASTNGARSCASSRARS